MEMLYVGTVFRTTQGLTLFTAVFYGESIIEVWVEEPEVEVIATISIEPEVVNEPIHVPVQTIESSGNIGNAVILALAIIGSLLGLGALSTGGFFLIKHFLGYNATIYSIDSPRDVIKAGKIKMDVNNPEPVIMLDNIVGHNLAKTDRYIVQIAKRVIPKLVNKTLRVVLHDKEIFHKVPNKALNMPRYEFDVNFSDDEVVDISSIGGDISSSLM